MFYSSILKKLSVFVQLSTQIQTHSSYFVKTLGLIRQNSQNFTWAINVFHKWHLWQIPGLRIPRKEVLAIQLSVPVKTYFFQPNPAVPTLKPRSDKNCWKKCLYPCCHQTLSLTHVIKHACSIKWSKLVRTCHSSLQSTLSCHRKPWYSIVKWRLRQKHSSSSPVCNDQVPTLISAEGVQSVLLYQCITISLPCKAWLGACSIVVGWCVVLCKCFEGTLYL